MIVIIHLDAIVAQAIAHHKIIDVEKKIVSGNLLKHLWRNTHRGSLVFHNHAWMKVAVVENAVATEAFAANGQFDLVGEQSFGIAFVFDKIMDEVLPHPLFRSECHVAPPKKIEYRQLAVVAFDPNFVSGQIQFLHYIYNKV